MAVFGVPRVHEDDALRAVRAAAEMRERLPALAERGRRGAALRTGVNTGAVVIGEGEAWPGDAVNVAARLEQAAAPGRSCSASETLALVRDAVEVEPLEPLELKGKSEPVAAFRLLRVDPRRAGHRAPPRCPAGGRERELRMLREAWERVGGRVRAAICSRCWVLAGVGKSRLVAELLRSSATAQPCCAGAACRTARGSRSGRWSRRWRGAGSAAAAVIERLTAAAPAARRSSSGRSADCSSRWPSSGRSSCCIDDLQWAEPMLLDLLDHVADLSRGAPILLVCTARPELLEGRAGVGRWQAERDQGPARAARRRPRARAARSARRGPRCRSGRA